MERTLIIDSSELKRTAVKEGVPQAIVEKDIALSLALRGISDSQLAGHVVFKGGTAIRKAYFKEARFSEDLDFSAYGAEKAEYGGMLRKALEGIDAEAFRFDVVEEEETAAGLKASARFKGPLAHAQRIRFDFSFRGNIVEKPVRRPIIDSYGIGAVELKIMSLEEILAEKLHALGNRSAARDLYDVWFLFEKGISVDNQVLIKKYSYYDEKFDIGKTIGNARKCKDNWTRDLRHLLRELPAYDPIEKMVEGRLSEISRIS